MLDHIENLELLTKSRDVLSADDFTLLKAVWFTTNCTSGAGGCVLGAGLHAFRLSPHDFYGVPVSDPQWNLKGDVQLRLAELLAPHMDLTLADEVLRNDPAGHYQV